MKCFFCKGKIADGLTTHVTDLGSCIIIIRNVPCHKCTQCREISYSLGVGERLEQITEALKSGVTEIAVVHYSDETALISA
jgi:YgiT-type zinc finger domain-containing protein